MSSFLILSTQGDKKPTSDDSTPWNVERAVIIKILVVVDINLLTSDVSKIKSYWNSYWKAVNKYVSLLKDPPVRIQMTELRNFTTKYGKYAKGVPVTGWASTDFILSQLNSGLNNATYSKNYDIAIIFTRWQLCTTFVDDDEGTRCTKFANTKLALPDDHKIYRRKPIKGLVGVVRDDGQTYQGIWDALFLIGTYLGAKTDGSQGADECNPEDSYIMAPQPLWHKFKFRWSNCSITAIRNNLKSRQTVRLGDDYFKNIPMPGELVSLDDFCRLTTRDVACFYDEKNCEALVCKLKDSKCKPNEIALPAPEGSWCENNKRCSFGKCVYV